MVLRSLWLVLRWVYTVCVHAVFRLLWAFSRPTKGLLPPVRDPCLLLPAHTLALCINQRKRSAESVVRAFVGRLREVDPVLRAVVDQRFEAAVEEAQEVDRMLAAASAEERTSLLHSRPLLGVPFTTKEIIMMKGLSHTGGLLARRGVKATTDAAAVQALRQAGAIPLCVNNVPELSMWWETSCLLYGRTNNPYDVSRTCGGSTGADAALVAAAATPLALGTDIAGSVRIPAFICGIFSHKPSSGIVNMTNVGIFPDMKQKPRISVLGPLCRSVRDLCLAMQVLAPEDGRGLQALVHATDISRLKIWWVEDLDTAFCSTVEADQKTALHAAVTHLQANHRCTTAKFQWPVEMWRTFFYFWRSKLAEETAGKPSMAADITNRQGEVSLWKEFLLWLCGRGRHTMAILLFVLNGKLSPTLDPRDTRYHWTTLSRRLQDAVGENAVLIMPTMPRVAPFHNETLCYFYDIWYTCVFNCTEMPVTAVPLGLSPEGLPVGVQVAARHGQDHLTLAVAAALEDKFGGWVPPCAVDVAAP